MAKKIRTFPEYDVARRERELNLPQAIESKLEQIIQKNRRKTERQLGGVEIISHPINFMKALLEGPEGIMQLYVKQQTERYTPQAEQKAIVDYFQQNMGELIGCSVSISKPHGSLSESQKQSFYARFLDNVKEFTDSKHFASFKIRYTKTEELVRGFHPPEQEEEFSTVATVTEGLCREKYITRENADTIMRLLSPRKEVQVFPIQFPPARRKTPAPVPLPAEPIFTVSTPEESLEYLTVVLRLPREAAQSYADQVTLQQLREFQQGINDAVGEEYAGKLVQANPSLVLYPSENLFTKYLTTLQVVQGRIRSNGDMEKLEREFGLESNVDKYASLEQLLELKRKLFQETAKYHTAAPPENPVEDFKVYVSRYAILQKIPVMEQRLDSLIKQGEFTVGRKEHWGERSRKTGGARGRNILTILRTELNHLFTDLGYDSPGCEINFDRHILSVPQKTQQLLSEIRDKVYQSQKK